MTLKSAFSVALRILTGCTLCIAAFAFGSSVYASPFSSIFTPITDGSQIIAVYGINDSGEIVGTIGFSQGLVYNYNNGSFTTLDFPGSTATTLTGINNAGQIVGSANIGELQFGFVYSGGVFTAINDPIGTDTQVSAINNAGEMVGEVFRTGFQSGFLLDDGKFTDLDDPNGLYTFPLGINDAGEVVGVFVSPSIRVEGFVYNDGVYTTFQKYPFTDVIPMGINDSGQIVGSLVGAGGGRADFFDSSGHFSTFNPLGGNCSTNGISDNGLMVGDCADGAFLAPAGATTPEPSSILLCCTGLLGLGLLIRRRDRRSQRTQ